MFKIIFCFIRKTQLRHTLRGRFEEGICLTQQGIAMR